MTPVSGTVYLESYWVNGWVVEVVLEKIRGRGHEEWRVAYSLRGILV